MRGEHGVAAAIDEPEHIVMRDFLAKTNAARAENAALVVKRDPRSELALLFGFFICSPGSAIPKCRSRH